MLSLKLQSFLFVRTAFGICVHLYVQEMVFTPNAHDKQYNAWDFLFKVSFSKEKEN